MTKSQICIHWFRRDFRWNDNTALLKALEQNTPVLPLFIFDKDILDKLEDKDDKRVTFIHQHISRLHADLKQKGSSLLVKYGKPIEVWQQLVQEYDIKVVFTNRDYEPYAQQRDKEIYQFLSLKNITFKGCKDHVIFEKNEVTKEDGKPYSVFTPYSKRWLKHYEQQPPIIGGNALELDNFFQTEPLPIISLTEMGFVEADSSYFPSAILDISKLPTYKQDRDFPAKHGTTKISVHLRFGTISIREMAEIGYQESAAWLNELIWRDFYQMIIFHHPQVVDKEFKPKYAAIPWRNSEEDFKKWCEGKTGYPMVDAGMRQLNETGFMHNRVRMVTACFLTKHLLIDWRWGERYFARKLLDFELASNNGGWQWAASTGCDAAPYFRVFNPSSQFKKFDKNATYVKKWVPEYGTPNYPKPMVEHKMARQRAIDTFKEVLQAASNG